MGETNHAFVFDDLEPEPGPKFASMSRKNSKKEKERLDREYHAERQARLEAQRVSQANVQVPNPLRRHTAEELLAKKAKRDAQSALTRQKRLKTVRFEY
jgi:hypothetical protein